MTPWRQFGFPLVVGLGATIAIVAVASVPYCWVVGILLLPGLLIGLPFAPQGVHSDHFWVGLAVAVVADTLFYSYLASRYLQYRTTHDQQ